MKTIAALTLSILCSWSGACLAYYVNGDTLVSHMYQWQKSFRDSKHTDYVEAARYSSYVLGVYDALSLTHIVCASSRTDAGQVASVVARYLQANPKRWSEPAFTLVANALLHAYPCKTAK